MKLTEKNYIERDVSWMTFNYRILAEAMFGIRCLENFEVSMLFLGFDTFRFRFLKMIE